MKKNFIKLAAAVALSILFSGCYFFVQLDADLKVVNNTDKTFYCLAAYNKYVGSNPTHWEVGPNATVNKTLKGHLTEADYADSTEYLYFWYIEKEVYEARLAENPDRDDWYIMIHSSKENDGFIQATNKRSQSYKVVFDPATDGTENYTIKMSW